MIIRFVFSYLCLLIFLTPDLYAAKVAKVMLLRGEVRSKIKGSDQAKKLKKGDLVAEGSIIQTNKKSFVKLLFNDKSTMSLGPKSQMIIEKFPKKKTGLISLVKGQLRSKVIKDPLRGQKNKLIIKTRTAAMGVRGTYFQTVYNTENNLTSVVTFEGEVKMAQLNRAYENSFDASALESANAVSIKNGQFAGTNEAAGRVNIPVKISPSQLEVLSTNDGAKTITREAQKINSYSSIIPPGLSAKVASNTNALIVNTISNAIGTEATNQALATISSQNRDAPAPEGFKDTSTGAFAPPAGGFVDLNTGLYIPPPPGSSLDINTGTYTPPPSVGGVAADGGYQAPGAYELRPDGSYTINQEKLQAIEASGSEETKRSTPPPPAITNDPAQYASPSETTASLPTRDVATVSERESSREDNTPDEIDLEQDGDELNDPFQEQGQETDIRVKINIR